MGTGKEWVATGTEYFIAVGVFLVELIAYQVSMVQIGQDHLFLYNLHNLDSIGLSVYAYLTHFSNFYISGSNAEIWKW